MDVTAEGWIPGRGDYGAWYATDLIPLVEERNCVKGCIHSGTAAEREEFGPGGTCHVLAMVSLGASDIRIPELVPQSQSIRCTARQDPAVAGMEPMFNIEPDAPEPIGPGETPAVRAADSSSIVSDVVGLYIKARMDPSPLSDGG